MIFGHVLRRGVSVCVAVVGRTDVFIRFSTSPYPAFIAECDVIQYGISFLTV